MGAREVRFVSEDPLEVRVKEYGIVVDLEGKRILHNCEDWAKSMHEGRFCKHLGRVFLSLPADRARALLQAIATDRDAWTFGVPEA